MRSRQLSLAHLIHIPGSAVEQGTSQRHPAILALHGRGSNESDLIELASHFPETLLWISPRAPLVLGPNSYEWYRVRVIGRPDPEQLFSAIETVNHFIDEMLSAYPIDPQRLYLLGFSQGSLLSMCFALIYPARVAGVIAQSGYIPSGVNLEINGAAVKGKPFLMTHGEQDTLIPVEWGRASRDRLQELGIDVAYREFQMGHSVSMESLATISAWLNERLGR